MSDDWIHSQGKADAANVVSLRALGILQEANRLFFYPLGMALTCAHDDVNGAVLRVRGRVPTADRGEASPERVAKADGVRAMAESVARQCAGQAPPDFEDGAPLAFDIAVLENALRELALPFIAGLVTQSVAIADDSGAALDAMAGPAYPGADLTLAQSIGESATAALLAGVLGPILDAITVTPGVLPRSTMRADGWAVTAPESTIPGDASDPTARRLALMAQRIRGIRDLEERHAQLLPSELADLQMVEVMIDGWLRHVEDCDKYDRANGPGTIRPPHPTPDELRRVALTIEDLYGRAQPGMLFFKGDVTAREKWRSVADGLRAEVRKCMDGQAETARFLAGRITVGDVADRSAMAAEIEARAAPLRDRLAHIQADADALAEESAQLRIAMGPMESAADRLARGTAEYHPENREKAIDASAVDGGT